MYFWLGLRVVGFREDLGFTVPEMYVKSEGCDEKHRANISFRLYMWIARTVPS